MDEAIKLLDNVSKTWNSPQSKKQWTFEQKIAISSKIMLKYIQNADISLAYDFTRRCNTEFGVDLYKQLLNNLADLGLIKECYKCLREMTEKERRTDHTYLILSKALSKSNISYSYQKTLILCNTILHRPIFSGFEPQSSEIMRDEDFKSLQSECSMHKFDHRQKAGMYIYNAHSIAYCTGMDCARFLGRLDIGEAYWTHAVSQKRFLNSNVLTSYMELLGESRQFQKATTTLRTISNAKESNMVSVPDEKTFKHILLIMRKVNEHVQAEQILGLVRTHYPHLHQSLLNTLNQI